MRDAALLDGASSADAPHTTTPSGDLEGLSERIFHLDDVFFLESPAEFLGHTGSPSDLKLDGHRAGLVFGSDYPLRVELQALLDASVNALEDDASRQSTQKVLLNVLTQTLQLAAMRAEATDAKTQAVMLDVMERSAQFVEANVAVPQFNSKEATGVRTLVFNVYHRLAKVLGRNTPEAVKADTKAMLAAASDRISYKTPPGRKPKTYKPADVGELEGPELHIRDVIAPVLDEDMKPLAYSIGIYSEPMKKFYNVLAQWKSENRLKRA